MDGTRNYFRPPADRLLIGTDEMSRMGELAASNRDIKEKQATNGRIIEGELVEGE